jgi:hypothetical protein
MPKCLAADPTVLMPGGAVIVWGGDTIGSTWNGGGLSGGSMTIGGISGGVKIGGATTGGVTTGTGVVVVLVGGAEGAVGVVGVGVVGVDGVPGVAGFAGVDGATPPGRWAVLGANVRADTGRAAGRVLARGVTWTAATGTAAALLATDRRICTTGRRGAGADPDATTTSPAGVAGACTVGPKPSASSAPTSTASAGTATEATSSAAAASALLIDPVCALMLVRCAADRGS